MAFKQFFMPLPFDSVGEGIMFSGCPSGTFFHLFVFPVAYCYISTQVHKKIRLHNLTSAEQY